MKILVKPHVTEKSTQMSEKMEQHVFIVNKKANKLQIKDAIEKMYGVSVESVNTSIIPGKRKNRFTKKGFISGKKQSYKKAIVRLADGEVLDLYDNI